MSKIQQICPACFSTRIRVKIGGGGYNEGGFYKIPEDFGEVFECPDCTFHGVGILEGNEKLVGFLFEKKRELKAARMQKKPLIEIPCLKEASNPIAILGMQAKV